MIVIDKIIVSTTQPLDTNVLWLCSGTLLYYNDGWKILAEVSDDTKKYYEVYSKLPLVLKGKFKENSKETSYKCTINDTEVPLVVNPTTKEFIYVHNTTVNSLHDLFAGNADIEELSVYGNSKPTDITSICNESAGLKKLDLSNLDTSATIDADWLFPATWDLIEFKLPKTKIKSKEFNYIFNCVANNSNGMIIDVSNFDTSETTCIDGMFCNTNNSSVEIIGYSNWNTSKLTSAAYVFGDAKAKRVVDISGWDTSKITSFSSFIKNSGVTKLILNADFTSCTNFSEAFFYCWYLTQIRGKIYNIKKTIKFNNSPLDEESVKIIIDGLGEVTTTEKLYLHALAKKFITDEQKATIASKGWTLVI